jgi:hypothetical protein
VWRFYLIATAIVALLGSVLFAHRLATGGWKMHVDTKAPPPSAHGNSNAGFVVTPPPFFDGQGGWVLSALPDCFDQLSSTTGPSALVRGHVPAASLRVAPGTTLHAGDCSVLVRRDDIWVYRGRDRLRVPPDARLYRTASGTTLVYANAGRTEVRAYRVLASP